LTSAPGCGIGASMGEPSNLPAIPNLPPLPEHCRDAWIRLEQEMSDCKTRLGLRYLLAGWTYRDAAAAAGLLSDSPLSDAVTRHGLGNLVHRTDRVVENHRKVALLGSEELIRRAEDGELKRESARDVAVVTGVSTDKVLEWEKKQSQPQEAISFLQSIAEGMGRAGMQLDVSLRPAGVDDETVRLHAPDGVVDGEIVR